MNGIVTALNLEAHTITIKPNGKDHDEVYRLDVPYKAKSGRDMGGCWMKNEIKQYDKVKYFYDETPQRVLFLKSIETESGGSSPAPAPQQATPAPSVANNHACTCAPSGGGYSKEQMIFFQHAQKIATEFLTANPDHIDTKDGQLDTMTAFCVQVAAYADLLTQGYCARYGLEYVNCAGGR